MKRVKIFLKCFQLLRPYDVIRSQNGPEGYLLNVQSAADTVVDDGNHGDHREADRVMKRSSVRNTAMVATKSL